MIDHGVLESASAASLAPSAEGQARLFADIERYADSIVLSPAYVSNSPEVIDRLGVIAVNSALELDIYGHVNSAHLRGTWVMNGIGGSGHFSGNALSAITGLPSIAAGGEISRIVPMVSHVDHTEHDIDVVITEQGIADVRRKSPLERTEIIIEQCAHQTYRSQLFDCLAEAAGNGEHIHHDLSSMYRRYQR